MTTPLDRLYTILASEQSVENATQNLLNELSALPNQTLKVSGIETKGFHRLFEALKLDTTLQSLELGYNDIGDEGAESMSDALKVNTTLQSLDLSDNEIGAEGAKLLWDALSVNKDAVAAAKSENSLLLRTLLENGVSPNSSVCTSGRGDDFFYRSALVHAACENGNVDILALLLEFNANMDLKNGEGKTGLMIACEQDKQNVVKFLLKAGVKQEGARDVAKGIVKDEWESMIGEGTNVNKCC